MTPIRPPARPSASIARRLGDRFDRVVARPLPPAPAGARLLGFDTLRAGLVADLDLPEVLYIDPDTDVVEDLSGVLAFEPGADLLWVANPLPLEPVVADLVRHGFLPADGPVPALVEPGFLLLRRDFSTAFAALASRHGDLHGFAPGSTLWNMLVISLGNAARRLPDRFNRTFWDVSAAATVAKSVHFTGQWKRLQPHVAYDRPARRIVIHDRPVAPPRGRAGGAAPRGAQRHHARARQRRLAAPSLLPLRGLGAHRAALPLPHPRERLHRRHRAGRRRIHGGTEGEVRVEVAGPPLLQGPAGHELRPDHAAGTDAEPHHRRGDGGRVPGGRRMDAAPRQRHPLSGGHPRARLRRRAIPIRRRSG